MTAAATGASTPGLIAHLLKMLISLHTFADKRITEKGRPKLNLQTKASKGFVRHFKDCNYEWLTASTEHTLFCRPCLLFNPSKGTWNDRPMDFIYKWQVSALLFEYCIMLSHFSLVWNEEMRGVLNYTFFNNQRLQQMDTGRHQTNDV